MSRSKVLSQLARQAASDGPLSQRPEVRTNGVGRAGEQDGQNQAGNPHVFGRRHGKYFPVHVSLCLSFGLLTARPIRAVSRPGNKGRTSIRVPVNGVGLARDYSGGLYFSGSVVGVHSSFAEALGGLEFRRVEFLEHWRLHGRPFETAWGIRFFFAEYASEAACPRGLAKLALEFAWVHEYSEVTFAAVDAVGRDMNRHQTLAIA